MMQANTLATAFEQFGLPPEARLFLLKVWETAQFLDDVADGDPPENLPAAIYTVAVGLPCDEFLAANRAVLSGALATMFYKWQAANTVERERTQALFDQAYMWRAGYYDLVLLVAALCLPRERVEALGPYILGLYGETRDEYLKEFDGA